MTSRAHPDRVALLAPMVSELRPVVKAFSLQRGEVGGVNVHVGSLGDVEIVAVKIGMGTRAAADATERLLDATAFDHVLVAGIAGGVVPGVEIGDLIYPSRVIDHASGAEFVPTGLAPGAASGTLLTSDEFFVEPEELEALAARGVVGLDMETAAVAAVCERRDCAWSVVRSVSDRPGEVPASVLDLAGADGTPNLGKAMRFMVTQPWKVPGLVRLARNSQRAANRAAAAAVVACTRP
ncbi:MAG: 5'-methylthioadenosine/S-adenosylhomocysteine nucleosidase family protein [Acidimicrobiia bacterium]